MPNSAQIATHKFVRDGITRLRGPQSYVPLSLDEVTPLENDGGRATFRVNGARVFIENSGEVVDAGLPDCPRYADFLLEKLLPAIAADLLMEGNPHKPFLDINSHTPESFEAYLQTGIPFAKEFPFPIAIVSRKMGNEANGMRSFFKFAHVDPDWENLTYGDCCDEPRAATLKNARVNDFVVNQPYLNAETSGCRTCTEEHPFPRAEQFAFQRLCLCGQSFIIVCIHEGGGFAGQQRQRSNLQSVHYGRWQSIDRNGRPRWSSSLRSCRIVIDLAKHDHRNRAEIVQQAVKEENNFDILTNIQGF